VGAVGVCSLRRVLSSARVRLAAALIAISVVASGLVIGSAPQPADAASVPFDPGYIISDANFYNGAAMSEAQIQAFLTSQGSVLATYRSSVSSRAARPSADIPGHTYCNAFQGGTNILASTIIYRAQVACGVSARVILVTLQKERTLITKTPAQAIPNDFLVAMGYGCPDTAPCNDLYFGLGNQIYMASLQFKFYQRPENGFNYQPGVRFIQYNPNSACGGTNVNILNWATAALYNYTPYQPSPASLAAYPGPASGADAACGAYGNRNFANFYSEWFGSPTGQINPVGVLESVTSPSPRTVRISGWGLDSNTQASLTLHVYVDGAFHTAVAANRPRNDVNAAYPSQTGNYGFDSSTTVSTGRHTVCVYAINVGPGQNTQLGCRAVSVAAAPVVEVPGTELGAVYRFWSATYNGHFYTRSVAERNKLMTQFPSAVWQYETVSFGAFGSQIAGTVPVYRFWSATYNGHFYTTSAAERDNVIAQYDDSIWKYETVAFYVYPNTAVASDLRPMERFWSPTYLHHFYTASATEAEKVKQNYPPQIWTYEHTAFKVPVTVPGAAPLP
jgi:hypothetical protein